MKYVIFVWAKDAGKFAKEYLEKTVPGAVDGIVVLGNELKIDDLKALQSLKCLALEIDSDCTQTKSSTEIFLLGRLYEKRKTAGELALVPYATLTKEAAEVAKNLELDIVSWNSLESKPSKTTKRNSSKVNEQKGRATTKGKKESQIPDLVSTSIKTEVEGKTTRKKAEKTPVKSSISAETAAKMGAVVASVKEGNSSDSFVAELVKKSKLPETEREYFSKPVNITAISEAVKNASDENFLSFQLKMRFGDRGEALTGILKKQFDKIRSM